MRYVFSILLIGIGTWGVWQAGILDLAVWVDLITWQMLIPCLIFLSLSYAAYILRGLRWTVITRGDFTKDTNALTLAYGMAFALGAFTPARSGDLARIEFTQRLGYPYSEVSGAYMAERLTDFGMLVSVFLLGVLVTDFGGGLELSWLFPAASAFIGLLGVLLLFLTTPATLAGKLVASKKVQDAIEAFRKGAVGWNKRGVRSTAFGLTVLIWALHVLATTGFLLLASPALPITIGLLFLTVTNLSGLLQLTPGNLGPFEIAGALVLTQAGLPASEALAVTVSLHIFSLAILFAYGLVCTWRQTKDAGMRSELE